MELLSEEFSRVDLQQRMGFGKFRVMNGLQNTPSSATHNPLISTLQIDTLTNVHDALCALKTLTDVQDFSMNEDTRTGLHLLMKCDGARLHFSFRIMRKIWTQRDMCIR